MTQTFAHEVFKAYDIRGVVGTQLTDSLVEDIGRAFGSDVLACGGKAVIVGRDGRLSGPSLSASLCRGLLQSGVDVIDIGLAPSPLVYFACHTLGIGSCIAITGSHNPPEYNGFKLVVEGETLSAERIQSLKERIVQQDFATGQGVSRTAEVLNSYVEEIAQDIKPKRSLKIVIDCGNGVAGLTAPAVFNAIGCEVIELYTEVDGHFPNHHPDPSDAKNLDDLRAAVTEHRADIGLAFDGDGDRLGVISPQGEIVWADRQMILFAQDVLSRQPGATILYDVKCSRNLHAAISAAGGNALMWRTGHSFMKRKLKESGAALAGEMSGHIFFNERWYGFDDGVYSGARLIELLAKADQSIAEVINSLPDSVNTPELKIHFTAGKDHHAFMQLLLAAADFPDGEICTIDGLRVDFKNGFGLVRASNTTPILVLRFEADNPGTLRQIQDRFGALIQKLDPELVLPF